MAATASAEVRVILGASERVAELATKKKTHALAESPGARVARLRRERGITQTELAEMLGVTQPVVSDYERGELRLHGELLVQLAAILGASVDEILGLEAQRSTAAVRDRRLARRLQQIEQLPKRDQQAILRTIDAFITAKAR
jgi:transcriptional regulator with XRE-family HTH domain